MRSVWVVSDAWSEDPFEVRAVFASAAEASAFITRMTDGADDYEQSRHHWAMKEYYVWESLAQYVEAIRQEGVEQER